MNDTKPLLAFATLLEHGSLNSAAYVLKITPFELEQQVAELENTYGVSLVKKDMQRFAPTEAGAVLAEHCLRLKRVLDDVQMALESVKNEAAGDVRLACPSALAASPNFQAALMRVASDFPQIRVQLVVGDAFVDVHSAQIDIAIRGGAIALNSSNLVVLHLANWRWQILASPTFLADKQISTPIDLHKLRWLSVRPIHYMLQKNMEVYQLDVDMTKSWHCGDFAALRHLAVAGLGVSVQVSGEVSELVDSGSLAIVLPEWLLPSVPVYAVTPHRVQSARVAAVLSCLRETFQSIV